MAKKRLTVEQRRRLAAAFAEIRSDLGEFRALLESVAERMGRAEAQDRRRRARLRRLTFGLLGR